MKGSFKQPNGCVLHYGAILGKKQPNGCSQWISAAPQFAIFSLVAQSSH
jgi:hypothetical protein